jgi:hypothetical protein
MIEPDERGGGILADEMGMGKSLSILALVMKTLDDGQEWAQQQNEGVEGKKAPKYSRSTLVVVSSARTQPFFPFKRLRTDCTSAYQQLDERNRKVNAFCFRNGIIANRLCRHLKGGLKVVKYHGPGRPKSLNAIQDSDIVVTTYNTLTVEYQTKSEHSLLHQIGWYRVVLDEGKPTLPISRPASTSNNLQRTSSAAQPQHFITRVATSMLIRDGVSLGPLSKTSSVTLARFSLSFAPSLSPSPPSSASGLKFRSSRTSKI